MLHFMIGWLQCFRAEEFECGYFGLKAVSETLLIVFSGRR